MENLLLHRTQIFTKSGYTEKTKNSKTWYKNCIFNLLGGSLKKNILKKISSFFEHLYTEKGTVVEAALVMPILIAVVFIGVDIVTFSRYASIGQWLSILAARVASVEKPDDGSIFPPLASSLKIPLNLAQPAYLPGYQSATTGCNGTPLSEQRLRTINLVLGEAVRIMQTKAKTASNWRSGADVNTNTPLEGELIVVPENCLTVESTGQPTTWKVCINIPLLVMGSKYVCFKSSSDYWKA